VLYLTPRRPIALCHPPQPQDSIDHSATERRGTRIDALGLMLQTIRATMDDERTAPVEPDILDRTAGATGNSRAVARTVIERGEIGEPLGTPFDEKAPMLVQRTTRWTGRVNSASYADTERRQRVTALKAVPRTNHCSQSR
jgi:hypothetical protein